MIWFASLAILAGVLVSLSRQINGTASRVGPVCCNQNMLYHVLLLPFRP